MRLKPAGYLTLGVLLATGVSCPVLAEEKTSTEEEEEILATTGTFEYGVGFVTDDSYRFGRYTGMEDEGPFAIGAFDIHFRPGRPDYLHLQGHNLGLDSRRLSLDYGEQGRYETHLEYRELPSFKMDSARTPYQNPGHDNLIVAPGASPTALLPMKLDTKRKRITGGLSYFPKDKWKTSLTVSHERKDGTDWIGGGLQATNGAGVSYGQTYAVVLPEPIDQTTTDVDASLEYNGDQSQWKLNLHGSLFDNSHSSLRWEQPGFSTAGNTGGGTGGGPGSGTGPGGGVGPGGGPGPGGGSGSGPGGNGSGPGGNGSGPGGTGSGPGGGTGSGPGGGSGSGPGGGSGSGPGGGSGSGPGGGSGSGSSAASAFAASAITLAAVPPVSSFAAPAAAAAGPGGGGPGGGGPGGGITLPGYGQLSLPPDNQFFQLGLSGSTRVSDTTRFTGTLSVGLMQQDEDFLPYGIDGSAAATAPLPRSSLDGEVRLYSVRAGVTSRPIRPLRLKAQYIYDERDNRTPKDSYLYDVMDSGKAATIAIRNEPLSYRKHKAKLGANYRFSSIWSGSAGYEYRDTERDYSDVEKTREHIGTTGLNWRPREDFDAALRFGMSTRDASDYQAELTNQNPLLRKYNLADRDQTKAGLLLNYAPMSNLNVGFSTDLVEDDYTESDLGLTDADSQNYNLDVSYFPTPDIQLNAFYSHDRIESRQLGSTSASADYKVDYDDKVDTVGLGARFSNVFKNWDLGLDYRYSQGTGETKYKNLGPATGSSSYPDLENRMHHVELSAGYQIKENTRVKFSAIYEHMKSDDWAVDGVSAYPSNQLLTLGNDTEDYDVYAFMISVQHRF